MDPRILIVDNGYSPVLIRQLMDWLEAEADIHPVIVHPQFHHHDFLSMIDTLRYHDVSKKDVPLFFIHNQEEEIQEMRRHSLLALAIGNAFAGVLRFTGESTHTPLILGALTSKKTNFSRPARHHRRIHRKPSILMGHTIPVKLKVPRGINRDNHGRPQPQKLTPARLTRRNGSR